MGEKRNISIFGSFAEPFNYSYFVDVSVSRIIDCVLMNFYYETFANQMNLFAGGC